MIISIGEILVDIFDDGKTRTRFPGGAPFNVAHNIASFGGDVCFYGAIGNDDDGRFLEDFMNRSKLPCFIAKPKGKDTTQAIVTLENGERNFRFNRKNGADYILDASILDTLDQKQSLIIHLGSLMLSEPEGRAFFQEAVRKIKANPNWKISFDVNYRDDIFPSSKDALGIFLDAISNANILKFTEEELSLLTGKDDIDSAIKAILKPHQIAVVTLGKEGSYFYSGLGKKVYGPTIPVKPVDTTGAGDAFYSYFLYSLDNHLDLSQDDSIEKALRKANFVGGYATQAKGAINVVPTIEQINKIK